MSYFANKKTLKDVQLDNKTIIVRLDFNVPIKDGKISDNKRISASVNTLTFLLEHNCKIIILSHLSRIKSLDDIKQNKKTLAPIAKELQTLLPNVNVKFLPTNIGEDVTIAVKTLQPREILLLENTRYNDVNENNEVVKKESKCDHDLGKFWASLADVFVNDAFGTAHRKHASNVGIAQNIKTSCIGFLIQKELENLSKITHDPQKPVVAILGGAKISDKLQVIHNLIKVADHVLICGGMAYTFLKAQGVKIGQSLLEEESIQNAVDILNEAKDKILLPCDFYCAKEFSDQQPIYKRLNEISDDLMGMDVGHETIKRFSSILNNAKTIFWNGPAGVFEFSHYQYGTKSICQILKDKTSNGAFTLIGGGDSAAAAVALGFHETDFSFISTGGGAALEFIGGETLPGIESIQDK